MKQEVNPGWDECETMVRDLCEEIVRLPVEYSGRQAIVVAVNRGGLVPGTMVSNLLGLKLVPVDEKANCTHMPVIEDHVIVLVDDMCDSGQTLTKLTQYFGYQLEGNLVISMTLYQRLDSLFTPTVYAREVDSGVWVNFPWELVQKD